MPVIIGTELNPPGGKWVDDFDAPELKPYLDDFRRGALILFGHTVEQANAGRGYCSPWALETFTSTKEKNAYFEKVGQNKKELLWQSLV